MRQKISLKRIFVLAAALFLLLLSACAKGAPAEESPASSAASPPPTQSAAAAPSPEPTREPAPEPEKGVAALVLSGERMDGTTEFMDYLEPGVSKTRGFPCGRYILKNAEGTEWISDEEAFGPSGHYSTTEVFNFEAGYSYYISAGTTGDFYGDSAGGFLN